MTAKVSPSYVRADSVTAVGVNYPFNRLYMEESKAPAAERLYIESVRDSVHVVYAVIHVSGGEAVLKDVTVDGVSIGERVKLAIDN